MNEIKVMNKENLLKQLGTFLANALNKDGVDDNRKINGVEYEIGYYDDGDITIEVSALYDKEHETLEVDDFPDSYDDIIDCLNEALGAYMFEINDFCDDEGIVTVLHQ